jgi:hypothetical protein
MNYLSTHQNTCPNNSNSPIHPCYTSQSFDNIGFRGDTEWAQKILDGIHDYPPDTDVWTKKILQEAQYTFSQMSGVEIATTVTTADFSYY